MGSKSIRSSENINPMRADLFTHLGDVQFIHRRAEMAGLDAELESGVM